MYSEALAELDRAVLRRLAEDLEDEGVKVRELYAQTCLDLLNHPDVEWAPHHAAAAAQRDADLSRIKTQLARVNRALDDKRAAAAEAKAARKAARK